MAIPIPTNSWIAVNGQSLKQHESARASRPESAGRPPGLPDHAFRYFRFYMTTAGESKTTSHLRKNKEAASFLTFVNVVHLEDKKHVSHVSARESPGFLPPCSRFMAHMNVDGQPPNRTYSQSRQKRGSKDMGRLTEAQSTRSQHSLPPHRYDRGRKRPVTAPPSSSSSASDTRQGSQTECATVATMTSSHISINVSHCDAQQQVADADSIECSVIPVPLYSPSALTDIMAASSSSSLASRKTSASPVFCDSVNEDAASDVRMSDNAISVQSSSTERNKEPTQRASSLKKRSDTAQRHVKWRGKRDEKQSVVTQGQGRKLSLAAWSRKPIDLFASGSDTYTPEERTTQDTGDAEPVASVQSVESQSSPQPASSSSAVSPRTSISSSPAESDDLFNADQQTFAVPEWVKGRARRNSTWLREQKRRQLEDEQLDKAQEMYEQLRQSRYTPPEEETFAIFEGPICDEDGWLAQFFIFQTLNVTLLKRQFQMLDEDGRGRLGPVETIIALRTLNNKLSLTEEHYLYRIMELSYYDLSRGTDFKLYAIMAALSQRIEALDEWMKDIIGEMDFATLDRKFFMCRRLWECHVTKEITKLSIDQLCVELRAGGVSLEHETEVRDKLGHLGSLDLLDFMTYIPLFIMIHESVVDNPLDDSRVK